MLGGPNVAVLALCQILAGAVVDHGDVNTSGLPVLLAMASQNGATGVAVAAGG